MEDEINRALQPYQKEILQKIHTHYIDLIIGKPIPRADIHGVTINPPTPTPTPQHL